MNTAGMEPAIWHYPLPGGLGRVGETVAERTTVIQPLVEAFASVSVGLGTIISDT